MNNLINDYLYIYIYIFINCNTEKKTIPYINEIKHEDYI